jgi:putative membrane protein
MKPVNTMILTAMAALTIGATSSWAQTPPGGDAPPVSSSAGAASPAKQDPSDIANKTTGTAPLDTGTTAVVEADKAFLIQAESADLAEIAFGKKALEVSQNKPVLGLAGPMVADHSKNSDQLKQLAVSKHVRLPTELDAKQTAAMTSLSALSGKNFDIAYAKQMIDDHEAAISLFQAAAANAKDPVVKDFATSSLPVLVQHQAMAKTLMGELGSAGN